MMESRSDDDGTAWFSDEYDSEDVWDKLGAVVPQRRGCVCSLQCGHRMCHRNRDITDGGWCRQWFVVRLLSDGSADPDQVDTWLACCFGTSHVQYWATGRSTSSRSGDMEDANGNVACDIRVLVRLDLEHCPSACLDGWNPKDAFSMMKGVVVDECRVERFRCCAVYLQRQWPGWLLTMEQKDADLSFGDYDVVDNLNASIVGMRR